MSEFVTKKRCIANIEHISREAIDLLLISCSQLLASEKCYVNGRVNIGAIHLPNTHYFS